MRTRVALGVVALLFGAAAARAETSGASHPGGNFYRRLQTVVRKLEPPRARPVGAAATPAVTVRPAGTAARPAAIPVTADAVRKPKVTAHPSGALTRAAASGSGAARRSMRTSS